MLLHLERYKDAMPDFGLEKVDKDLKAQKVHEIETLFILAIQKLSINITAQFSSAEDSPTYMNLALYYGFFVEPVDKNSTAFKIIIPYLWAHKYNFSPLPRVSSYYTPVIDLATSLETHVQNTILLLSNIHHKVQSGTFSTSFPFLANTYVGDKTLSETKYLDMNTLDSGKKAQANLSSRQKVFDNQLKGSSQYMTIRTAELSSLPDIISVIPNNEGPLLIAWQMKNYPTTKLSSTKLQKELKLFTDLLEPRANVLGTGSNQDQMSKKYPKKGVFVVILNGQGDEDVESIRGRLIENEIVRDKDNNVVLTVPENVQVYIPTKPQLYEVFGEKSLKLLLETGKVELQQPTNSEL